MPEKKPSERLEAALEAMMRDADAAPSLDPQLEPLLRLAGDLRDLPRPEFKARLLSDLFAGLPRRGLPRILEDGCTEAEIMEGIRQVIPNTELTPLDIPLASRDLPERSMRFLTPLNKSMVGVAYSFAHSTWEWHETDELLYMLDGDADIVTLTEGGPVQSAAPKGSLFVCPAGLWHQVRPRSPLTMLFATPSNTEGVGEDDPRVAEMLRKPIVPERQPPLGAADLRTALAKVPKLIITEETTGEDADAAVNMVGRMDESMIGVMSFQGRTPWERHDGGDELLYVLDGEVDLTAMTDEGARQVKLTAGNAFICPRGIWHRQNSEPSTSILYVTPVQSSRFSFADDPRIEG